MKVWIKNEQYGHGLTFELALEPENETDQAVFNKLKEKLSATYLKLEETALYSYKIKVEENQISIGLAEQVKSLAKVNNRWNQNRLDQKFIVLIVEGDKDDIPDDVPRFLCHWCHQETRGIERLAIEVYDPQKNSGKKLVQVHDRCQKQRERQMAAIPFNPSSKSTPIDECAQDYCHHDEHR